MHRYTINLLPGFHTLMAWPGTHQDYSKISQPQIKITVTIEIYIGYDYSKLFKHSFKVTTYNN